jgi:glycosyltransferase involved in cell wall biosynthesis
MNNPKVSVIVPVLNGEPYIAKSLGSIKRQTFKNIEIIVVDNFSQDKTIEIAKLYTDRVYMKGPERASQDNFGVEMSTGKYVFITGCDMVLDSTYIEQCVTACEEGGNDAVYSSVKSLTKNFWSKVKGFERELYVGDDNHEAARFFKREVFLDLGGYDSEMILHADDYDMQRKLNSKNYKTGRIDAYELHIDEIDSIKEIFFKSFYYGMNSILYIKKYKKSALIQLSPIRTAYFRKPKYVIKNIHLFLGLIAFKFVQYASATLGLLCGLLGRNKLSKYVHNIIYKK